MKQYTDVSLLKRNTFGIEAKAARLVEFSSVDALVDFLAGGFSGKSLVIGGGSNLLFVDDFDGTVFHSTIMDIDVVEESADDVLLRVGSGVNWDALVAYTVEKGWCGLENLSLIPGEVGASAVQNVGAYGVEAGDLIEKVDTVRIADAVACSFTKADCDFAYRHSIFKAAEKGRHIVTYVTYRLHKSVCFKLSYGNLKDKVEELGGATLANVRRAVCEIREAKLPNPEQVGSAGSFFMNPIVDAAKAAVLKEEYPAMPQYALADGSVKLSAGWLIEQCGWKQTPHEHVGVYKHQALVVVNLGGATGRDVLDFAQAVVASVKEKFGVCLNMEVNAI
ncbi:MAG: UDP-N-acetylmuramate dehydrogenase [Bacteroidaceae bacterium]|nr:UDP-N-acetylmuramate dehydrogenase [Bacteroidaceae bacterium]